MYTRGPQLWPSGHQPGHAQTERLPQLPQQLPHTAQSAEAAGRSGAPQWAGASAFGSPTPLNACAVLLARVQSRVAVTHGTGHELTGDELIGHVRATIAGSLGHQVDDL